jgi:hypothetical protein
VNVTPGRTHTKKSNCGALIRSITQLRLRVPSHFDYGSNQAKCIVHLLPATVPTRAARAAASGQCPRACVGRGCIPTLRLLFSVLAPRSHIPLLPCPLLLCRFTHAFARLAGGVRCSWQVQLRVAHSHARAARRCAPNPRTNCLKMQSRSSCFQPQQQVEHFLVKFARAKMRPHCIAARATGPSAMIAALLRTAKVQ